MPRLHRAFLALLLILPAGFAQAAGVVYPGISRIGLVPLPGLAPATHFAGFDQPKAEPGKGVVVLFNELPPEAYAEIAPSMNAQTLGAGGLQLVSKARLPGVAAENILAVAERNTPPAAFRRYVFVVKGADMTGMVTAQVPQGAKPDFTDAAVRKMLASYAVRAKLTPAQQLAGLPFKIGDMQGFRFVQTLAGNAVMLTDGPKDVVKSVEQPTVVVAAAFSPVPDNEKETFGKRALSSLPQLKDIRFESDEYHPDQQRSETVATARAAEDGDLTLVLQSVQFSKDGYLRVVAQGKAVQRDALIPRFRKLIASVTAR